MRFSRKQRQLEDEIDAHFQMAVADRVARGESPEEAKRAARREFGGEALVKEATRDMWRFRWLAQLAMDLRFGARMLRKNPGFTAVVVLTLALGIGANTAIFSVIHAALAPIPIPEPDRVVMVWSDFAARGWHGFPASAPDFEDWRRSGVFTALAATSDSGANLRWNGRTERVSSLKVTSDYWKVAAVAPQIGRVFTPEEFQPDRNHVVMLSDSIWRASFGAEPGIAGRTVILDGVPYTVVGVLGKKFPQLGEEQIYTPLALPPGGERGSRSLIVVGRLAPGLTLEAAGMRMTELAARLGREFKDDFGITVRLQRLEEAQGEDSAALLTVLLGAVGFVLLIACANLASLALARGTVRTREMTVRAALGAGRWRLVRQLLTENLLLAVLGGLAAIVPAWLGVAFIRSYATEATQWMPYADLIGLNWSVLGFNFAMAIATGLLFGLTPAWQSRKVDVSDALKASGRGNTAPPHQRLRAALVAGEIAFTLVLLAGAGLMIESFWRLRSSSPGFDAHNVVSMRIALADRQYADSPRQAAFFESALERIRALPGVLQAGAADELPYSDDLHGTGFIPLDRPAPRREDEMVALFNSVTPGYFQTLRVPLRQGRFFSDLDRAGAPRVALVDEWTASHFWPHTSAVGKMFQLSREDKAGIQIVGVVGDVESPPILKLRVSRFAQVYLPMQQKPIPAMALAIRGTGDVAGLIPAVREIVRRQDADQPVFQVRKMEDVLAEGRMPQKLAACLLGVFAAVALLLASLGIYGVIAYTVNRRWREFGIRISLGASPAQILAMVLRQGAVLAAVGIAAGLAGSFLLTRAMGSLLYRIGATDPVTFAGVTVLLAGIAMMAAYVPARRATRVDPAAAVREE
jgi:putative ABC transport system permease protein